MKRLRLRSKVRTAFQGRSRGLTLVELVIAMALIAIIAVAFLGGLSNAIMSLVVADVRTTAESLARSEMEYVKQTCQDDPDGCEDRDPPGFDGYAVEVCLRTLSDGLQEITVAVSYKDREEPVITLVGYRAER